MAIKFKIICPNCGAAVVPIYPEALIWELCQSCRQHVWDVYDLMMAEVHSTDQESEHVGIVRVDS